MALIQSPIIVKKYLEVFLEGKYSGYNFDYERTEEDQFEEWDREEEEKEKNTKDKQ